MVYKINETLFSNEYSEIYVCSREDQICIIKYVLIIKFYFIYVKRDDEEYLLTEYERIRIIY